MRKLPRQWIINVVYSVIGEQFRQWVSTSIKKRNDELADKRDLLIELDPEIAKAFRSSVNISSKCSFLECQQSNQPFFVLFLATKGRGVHILKPGSKRRRTQADMDDQLGYDDVVQADLKKSKSKVLEQKAQIENLASQLNSL